MQGGMSCGGIEMKLIRLSNIMQLASAELSQVLLCRSIRSARLNKSSSLRYLIL